MTDTNKSPSDSSGCGLGTFRPKWLQHLAHTRSFMIVYGLLGMVQSMTFVYFIATLTTLERQFGIPSRTTGVMISGNEVSQILLSLVLTYAGGQRNRPLWLGWGVALSGISCFIITLPHFIYGPGNHALSFTKEYIEEHGINQTSIDLKEKMGLCSKERSVKDCDMGEYSVIPSVLVFISQFILGIGSTLYYSLGQTYIDDNTKKTKTPMVLGFTFALRTIGPSIGFVVGFLCLSVYVSPNLTPLIDKKDPRWIGAWWLGWLVLGSVMLVFAFLISLFPKHLPPSKNKVDDKMNVKKKSETPLSEKEAPSFKEFPTALKRLLKNKLLVINIFSGVFYILGSSAYITYLARYIEVQFEKSATNATIVLGPAVLGAMVIGFLISGYVISKFKPRPKYLLGWNVIVGMVYIVGEITLMFISCQDTNLVGFNRDTNRIDVINHCNNDCGCENLKYSPVCYEEKLLTFYSACHAGCHQANKGDKNKTYENCMCLSNDPEESAEYETYILKDGPCLMPCGYNFQIFIGLMCIMQLLGSSGKIGNLLVNYRAVLPEDKSFAQGFALLLISLLAFIPGPILFGAIMDASCLIRDSDCAEKGNCWFYDKHSFRTNLNMASVAFTSIGVILDGLVCYMGRNLPLYDEEEQAEENGQIKTSSM
ncbi:solute carrier organic anion transporter family member 4C1 isoform X2 [Cimex lectularius]|uniref:Solute carrier organic anion transporter family member n=1 Tax=Cimex lectularius TaxID=79782 RepID=A0A8I6RJM8_CIMLE|nr:solute carrier organic anion transporter family member 4C1 isoform X2 [Cimex lectularius]